MCRFRAINSDSNGNLFMRTYLSRSLLDKLHIDSNFLFVIHKAFLECRMSLFLLKQEVGLKR